MTKQSIPGPRIQYDFREVSSTIVPDITGSGFAGVIRGDASGNAHMEAGPVFGETRPYLSLSGRRGASSDTEGSALSSPGESAVSQPSEGYLLLPEGCAGNEEGLSVGILARIRECTETGALFSFGADACLSLLCFPDEEDDGQIILWPSFTTAGRSQEASCWGSRLSVRKGQWFHLSLSLSADIPSKAVICLDGRKAAEFSHRRAGSSVLKNSTFNCLGSGHFAEAPLAADIAEFVLFDQALDEEELASLFRVSPAFRFSLEKAELAGILSGSFVLDKEYPLPARGSYGCDLVWSLPEESLAFASLQADGLLSPLRPKSGAFAAEILLNLSLQWENEREELSCRVTVPPLPSARELAICDLEEIDFAWPEHTVADVALPDTGKNGSKITWKSSDPDILDTDGHITRGADSHTVILTAKASLNKASAIRNFLFRVLPSSGKENAKAVNGLRIRLPRQQSAPAPVMSRADTTAGYCRLTDSGLLSGNAARCMDYLKLLDPDRMLYNFRRAFGEDTRGAKAPGGWEEPAGLLRGHSTGHFLSALAWACASTGETAFGEKAALITGELARLQKKCHGDPAAFVTACTPSHAPQSDWSRDPETWGEGFLSAYSPDQFALLEQYTPYATIWAPYYTLHKLLAGLLDVYCLTGNRQALDVACGIGDWVSARLGATGEEQRKRMWSMYIAGEYGGMNEVLARLSSLTGQKKYLETASLFDNPKLFDGLAEGRDTIAGLHANQHIPQVIGALACYDAGGDERYYTIARNFFSFAVNRYTYSIGGVGRGEIFREPGKLAVNIASDRTCETCAAYNMIKLAAGLYRHEPEESSYMDYCERALLNQIAASQSPRVSANRHNGVTYMLPIGPGARKEYSSDYQDFTCCHGTGMENHVRYAENIFFAGKGSLFINLYIGADYYTNEGLLLSLDTAFPAESTAIVFARPWSGRLMLRIPDWCKKTFRAESRIRGTKRGGYLEIAGDFEKGEKIILHTPFSLHLCAAPDHPMGLDAASVMYGPMVMVARDERKEWLTLALTEDLSESFTVNKEGAYPRLFYEGLEFIPMYAAHEMAYHTYFRICYR